MVGHLRVITCQIMISHMLSLDDIPLHVSVCLYLQDFFLASHVCGSAFIELKVIAHYLIAYLRPQGHAAESYAQRQRRGLQSATEARRVIIMW